MSEFGLFSIGFGTNCLDPKNAHLLQNINVKKEKKMPKDRKTYIGGSDMPIILGLSTYITPYQLYLIKKGELEIESGQDAEIGKRLEPVIRDLYLSTLSYERRKGWTSNMDDYGVQHIHPDYPFLVANLDFDNDNFKGLAEFKSSRHLVDEMPMKYHIQVAYYCAITGYEWADIAVLSQTHDFKVFTYKKNEKLEKMLVNKAIEFWERIKNDDPPPNISESDIRERNRALYKSIGEDVLTASDELQEKLERYREAKEESAAAQKKEKAAKIEIINEIEEYSGIVSPDGDIIATYKFDKSARETADMSKLKVEFPDVWEKVKKENAPSRRFIVKKR